MLKKTTAGDLLKMMTAGEREFPIGDRRFKIARMVDPKENIWLVVEIKGKKGFGDSKKMGGSEIMDHQARDLQQSRPQEW